MGTLHLYTRPLREIVVQHNQKSSSDIMSAEATCHRRRACDACSTAELIDRITFATLLFMLLLVVAYVVARQCRPRRQRRFSDGVLLGRSGTGSNESYYH